MFIRTLKVFKKQNKTQNQSQNSLPKGVKNSIKKHTIQSKQNLSEMRKIPKLRQSIGQLTSTILSPDKIARDKLTGFQNIYIKAQAKRQSILDERKQFIKEKIKDKVKQQLADLIKRSQFMYSSSTDMRIKNQFMKQAIVDVQVKGNSLKTSMRASYSQRPQLARLQKIRKANQKKYSLKQTMMSFSEKTFTLESSPRQRIKGRRSLSNIIRLHQITAKKGTRNIHSALDDFNVPPKKDSVQIQPWQYTQDY